MSAESEGTASPSTCLDEGSSSERSIGVIRFVCLSDTHTLHHEVDVPAGDVLLHAGDFTALGPLKQTHDFNAWLGTLPHPEKVVVAGNHEIAIDKMSVRRIEAMFTNAVYLQDTATTLSCGIKIWGAPWIIKKPLVLLPMVKWDSTAMRKKWELIPRDTDILLTHSPPAGIMCEGHGCPALRTAVTKLGPPVHCFGHAHGGHGFHRYGVPDGETGTGSTLFINAANYLECFRKPVVFDFDLETRVARVVAEEW